ncbi:hypothetical protein CPC735_060560 [Coccidioides posadasii C735 delta SOWgp]|uniref:Threonine/serine exporter-like N-terminal domain-containing protein n=1 Tax=Coccidioides posadasii (strain C735) TaxID=222929 RepID=C5PFJ7_COCP7|nr:hypothetical protein CPC735_060560 [Coccidioides posadasii C735 delta SOWgp]EER24686.1 hypothetical protein CPC735_060560 [Coccidioides posadasii C735 delta SOWgp]|eukprot:XP_003066831.1 hypothetical protein CPC735_060560 [Coccidioides posadasii C735 delta SOWgp]
MEEENPYFSVSTEALLPTPASCRSSRTPSPSGIHMAPSRPALRRDNITRNGRPEGKELRWTNPVGDASENPQDILPDSAEDGRPRAPQIPPAVHLSFDTPTYNGESADDHNVQRKFERRLTGFPSDVDEEPLRQTSSEQRKSRELHFAYERAQKLASRLRMPSFARKARPMKSKDDGGGSGDAFIPVDLNEKDDSLNEPTHPMNSSPSSITEAHNIVRRLSRHRLDPLTHNRPIDLPSGQVTPYGERDPNNYVEPRSHYRGSILFNLLKLYHNGEQEGREESQQLSSSSLPLHHSPQQSISIPSTPRTKSKWYDKSKNLSSSSLSTLLPDAQSRRSSVDHGLKHSRSSSMLASAAKKLLPRPRLEDEIRISVHIAETISRQRYLMKLCQALMKYGAPTHRLEEYMCMTARVLEIDAQFLYVPGCMFFSFGDSATHTTELKLLKYPPGLDLGRLADVHEIYKEVVHDVIGVEEAIQTLDEINRRKDKYNKWWLIFFYGCASACVGPFAFEAGALDMPIAFLLGCILGALKYLVVPRSPLYSNVFELTAAMVTSFLARAFGSIRADSGESRRLFCFPALAQSSIALILPGYMVLCSSLELQSRNMLAGSVRLVYSIIYSLVLGFGMMLGTSFYGSMDPYATSAYACRGAARFGNINEYARKFPSVILFTLCLVMINQAKWKQAPVMIIISFAGYVVNFFSVKRFANNTQIASVLGAFVIGVMGNLYSRLRHGLAAAAILPAIFVQVPSGLAASGSLLSSLAFANEINRNKTATHNADKNSLDPILPVNLTETSKGLPQLLGANKMYGNVVFDLAYGMVQVSIAITVGLFLAALVVYPLGKRRSGLFSF